MWICLGMGYVSFSQASSVGKFEFEIQFDRETSAFYEVSYLPRSGHVLKNVSGYSDQKQNKLILKGESHFIVRNDFPLFLIKITKGGRQDVEKTVVLNFNDFQRHFDQRPRIVLSPGCTYFEVQYETSPPATVPKIMCKPSQEVDQYLEMSYVPESDLLVASLFLEKLDKAGVLARFTPYFICPLSQLDLPEKRSVFTDRYGVEFRFIRMDSGVSASVLQSSVYPASLKSAFAKAVQHNKNIAQGLFKKYGAEWYHQLPFNIPGVVL
ncbi:hypothetical protein [Nonlabens xiamenensis]|uniref:hypothetical protein n=1 Tax=Nonlabens xiamenensis TaxID=2341043 RepID=UPI000F612EA8|nr:hypothetical protein [Nonlabens xiamenensis]